MKGDQGRKQSRHRIRLGSSACSKKPLAVRKQGHCAAFGGAGDAFYILIEGQADCSIREAIRYRYLLPSFQMFRNSEQKLAVLLCRSAL